MGLDLFKNLNILYKGQRLLTLKNYLDIAIFRTSMKIKTTTSVRLYPKLNERMTLFCFEKCITKTDLIERAIEEFLDKYE